MGQRAQDASRGGHQERVRAAAKHQHRPLGSHRYLEGVRKGAVVLQRRDPGQRGKTLLHVRLVDTQQAAPELALERLADLGAKLRRATPHVERADGEDRGLERGGVRPRREYDQQQADQDRATAGNQLPERGQAGAAGWFGARRHPSRTRCRALGRRHLPPFAADRTTPTTRVGPGIAPRARGRLRSARVRACEPRPSARSPRRK